MGVAVDTIIDPPLDEEKSLRLTFLAETAVDTVLETEGKKGEESEVSILFTDDEFIAELNRQYRDVEGPTDVLSFPMMDPESEVDSVKLPGVPDMLGDVVISLETAEAQAKAQGKTSEEEICLLLVHGTLHLLGYDHDTPEREAVMWDRQEKALRALLARVKS